MSEEKMKRKYQPPVVYSWKGPEDKQPLCGGNWNKTESFTRTRVPDAEQFDCQAELIKQSVLINSQPKCKDSEENV